MRDQWRRGDGNRLREQGQREQATTENVSKADREYGAGRSKKKVQRRIKNERAILDILAEDPEAVEELLPS